jgi:DNA-binding transcriptional ArsR family regulator
MNKEVRQEGIAVDAKTQAKYEARAKIIKAMAHPTRLFIVDELARSGERCVCELTAMVGVDMSTVSRHLAMLKNAGIVEDRKHGATVYYSLRVRCVLDFLECVESVMKCNAKDQRRLLVS